MVKRVWIGLALATLPLLLAPHGAVRAQDFPSRVVKLIVPYGPGTTTDAITRILGERLARLWGQPVVVENVTGAGGVVGTQALLRSAPDGYTLAMIASNYAINPAVYPNLPYDPIKDITPVVHVTSNDFVLAVHPEVPAKTLPELIELARKSPGALNFGSGGNGSSPHLAMEKLSYAAGVKMTHIPYRAMGGALTDLLAGRLTLIATSLTTLLPHINAGKLRAIAVTGSTRNKALPDVPRIAEFVPGYEVKNWNGVVAPAGTSLAVVAKLERDIAGVFREPEFRKAIEAQAVEIELLGSSNFAERIASEIASWKAVVSASGARAE